MTSEWKVYFSKAALKQYKLLKKSGMKKPSVIDAIDALVLDLELNGPIATNWPNFGQIKVNKNKIYFHCHVKKGNPTVVACWMKQKENKLEVFYVGSHENAPY